MLKRTVTSKQRRNVIYASWLWEVQIKCKSHSVRLGLVSGVWISLCTRISFDIWWYKPRFRRHKERYEKRSAWRHRDVKMLFDAKILHRFFLDFSRLRTCTDCPWNHRMHVIKLELRKQAKELAKVVKACEQRALFWAREVMVNRAFKPHESKAKMS